MAVYREGYSILETIGNNLQPVYTDAADIGAPVKKGDKLWNAIQQLKQWYGPKPDFPEDALEVHKDLFGGYFDILLMDEWAVSDRRKTEAEATERYRIHYCKIDVKKHPSLREAFKDADGFVYFEDMK